MGFSLPSPAVSHPDMPFMAWVRNYQLSCIIWLYNIQQFSTLTGTSDYYTATLYKDGIVLSKAAYKLPGDFFNDNFSQISWNNDKCIDQIGVAKDKSSPWTYVCRRKHVFLILPFYNYDTFITLLMVYV